MPIVLQIEVSDRGLRDTRDEIHAFLRHESTRTHEAAHLAYVVLRKLLRETEREIERQAKDVKKPKPIPIKQKRRAA